MPHSCLDVLFSDIGSGFVSTLETPRSLYYLDSTFTFKTVPFVFSSQKGAYVIVGEFFKALKTDMLYSLIFESYSCLKIH